MNNININLHEIILIFKYVFSSTSAITNKLSHQFEMNLLEKINMLSKEHIFKINTILYYIYIVLKCMDFNKFSKNIECDKIFINSYDTCVNIATNNIKNDVQRQFLLSILRDSQILFTCIDLLMINPKKCAEKLSTYNFVH